MDIHKIILENLTSGIISFNENGIILYLNPMASKILHLKNSNISGKSYKDVFYIYPSLCELIEDIIKNDKIIRRGELMITHSIIELKIGYSSMIIKAEDFKGYTIIFQDLSIIEKKWKKL